MTRRGSSGAVLVGAFAMACGTGPAPFSDDAGSDDAGAAAPDAALAVHLQHEFPPITVPVGADLQGICQAWTLDNDEEIWVAEVEMNAGPGWHHSNWMFVPESAFAGEDGTFPCRERGFDEVAASVAGGSVFFAQSTQSTHEVQRFPAGAAYRIPPRSRVIGSVHVINFTGAEMQTAIGFRVGGLRMQDVRVRLVPLAIDNRGIELAPRTRTAVETECDFRRITGGALFSVYYVLPHYHALADGLRVEIAGGERDGQVIFETTGGIGNALGGPIEPPVNLAGASGLRVRCTYHNGGAEVVRHGPNATDEMCTILAYTDGSSNMAGLATSIGSTETQADGTVVQRSDCLEVRN